MRVISSEVYENLPALKAWVERKLHQQDLHFDTLKGHPRPKNVSTSPKRQKFVGYRVLPKALKR